MSSHFDVIILGTGPAASRIAEHCSETKRVAIAESRQVGGTCALRGCNPKKVFVRAAELLDAVRRADGKLLSADNASIDWAQLVAFKNTFTEPVPEGSRKKFDELGVTIISGEARFASEDELLVNDNVYSADQFAVCTGAEPMRLEIPGVELLTDSADFMQSESLPETVLFIGAGYISMEFAHVARRANRSVRILEQGSRPLAEFDPDLVERLTVESRSAGIEIVTEATVTAVREIQERLLEVSVEQDGRSLSYSAGMVVHGAGRVPAVSRLHPEQGGIECSDSGIVVNEYLQSVSNPRVFAAGDVAATEQPQLTPVANVEAHAVAQNITDGLKHRPKYGAVPKVVFSIPALASCGLSEIEAKDRFKDVRVLQGDMSNWSSYRKVGANCAAYKLLVDGQTQRLLGVHLLGPEAAEMINLFAVAMSAELTTIQIKNVLMAFPTFTSNIRQML